VNCSTASDFCIGYHHYHAIVSNGKWMDSDTVLLDVFFFPTLNDDERLLLKPETVYNGTTHFSPDATS
jgi:hypothetical protein